MRCVMGDGWWVMGLISYCIYSAFEKASSPPENSSSPKASRGVKKRWSGIILKTLCWIQIKQKRKKKGRGKLESLINTAKRRLYLTYHQTSNITRQNHHMSKYDPSTSFHHSFYHTLIEQVEDCCLASAFLHMNHGADGPWQLLKMQEWGT